jgi:hypothetical protein
MFLLWIPSRCECIEARDGYRVSQQVRSHLLCKLPNYILSAEPAALREAQPALPSVPRESEVSEPKKTTEYVCGHCEGDKTMINPAWLTWKRERAGLSIDAMAKKLASIKTRKGGKAASYQYVYKLEAGAMRCTPEVLKIYSALTKAEEPFKTRRMTRQALPKTKPAFKRTTAKKVRAMVKRAVAIAIAAPEIARSQAEKKKARDARYRAAKKAAKANANIPMVTF